MKAAATITAPAVNGLKLLGAVRFDRHLCAVLIVNRDDWREILDSMPLNQRKNVGSAVVDIRSALGLKTDYDVRQGSE
jgi:hypothetical protein